MSQIKPLADKVVAVQIEAQNKTVSGIYLPDKAKEKPQPKEREIPIKVTPRIKKEERPFESVFKSQLAGSNIRSPLTKRSLYITCGFVIAYALVIILLGTFSYIAVARVSSRL